MQSFLLALLLEPLAVPGVGLRLLTCAWLWCPRVQVSVFQGDVCGSSPAGKLLLRGLRKSGAAARATGSLRPELSAEPLSASGAGGGSWGQQQDAPPVSERLVPGNSDLGKRRGPWHRLFQRCLNPRAPQGPATHWPPGPKRLGAVVSLPFSCKP